MKDGVIPFLHRYHKLSFDRFTTIRGKSWSKKVKVGDRFAVALRGERLFDVEVVGVELRRVADMDVQFLKADAEYAGFELNSREEFVALLNSFRAPAWKQATVHDEMTVLTLRRVAT